MTAEHTTESALRTRIAQLEADVIYIRGLCERADDYAAKADAQNERLRKENVELVEALRRVYPILCRKGWIGGGIETTVSELLKKYEQ